MTSVLRAKKHMGEFLTFQRYPPHGLSLKKCSNCTNNCITPLTVPRSGKESLGAERTWTSALPVPRTSLRYLGVMTNSPSAHELISENL